MIRQIIDKISRVYGSALTMSERKELALYVIQLGLTRQFLQWDGGAK